MGYEVAEELGTLFLVVADATVLQLRQDLDQYLQSEGITKVGLIEVARATDGGNF